MSTETNQEAVAQPEMATGEESKVDTIAVPKSEYDKLNQTLGSLKRELKDLQKAREEAPTPTTNTPDSSLLKKAYLRAAGITADDEVDLALSTANKWGVEVDQLVNDEDFTMKLDKLRTKKANIAATSNVEGGGGGSQAKLTPEYWVAKGTPPSASDVPDRKTRATIVRAMMSSAKGGKTFYND